MYIYIRCIYGIFGWEITKYTIIYGVYIRFWPTLGTRYFGRQIPKYTVIYGVYTVFWQGNYQIYGVYIRFWPTLYLRYFWQGYHQLYGHIRCIYTVLANPRYTPYMTVVLVISLPKIPYTYRNCNWFWPTLHLTLDSRAGLNQLFCCCAHAAVFVCVFLLQCACSY